jgi:hypothetical protein
MAEAVTTVTTAVELTLPAAPAATMTTMAAPPLLARALLATESAAEAEY